MTKIMFQKFKVINADIAMNCKSNKIYTARPIEFREDNKLIRITTSDDEDFLKIVTYDIFEEMYLKGHIYFLRPVDASAFFDRRGAKIIHPTTIKQFEERNKELMKGWDEVFENKN